MAASDKVLTNGTMPADVVLIISDVPAVEPAPSFNSHALSGVRLMARLLLIVALVSDIGGTLSLHVTT